uniref:Uncharacterized protein n=1 Tax=Caenorhabditis tropicalis TaxID=1561998 RepID=A0A1I7V533_9PELO
MEMFIGFVMCIFLIIQCAKKKQDKDKPAPKATHLVSSERDLKKPSRQNSKEAKKGEEVAKSKSGRKSTRNEEKGGKGKSKRTNGSKRTNNDGDKDSSSTKRKSNAPSKPMDGTQNGPTPNDPTGMASEYQNEPDILNNDEIKDALDVTIDETDNRSFSFNHSTHSFEIYSAAVHERVTRLAATELIFDPKMVAYKGNVDNEKDPKEVEELEKELQEACDKHEARFKNLRKLEEKDPNYRRPKSVESEKSIDKRAPVPPDQRIKMRPDQCVLYETKEQVTEDDELDQQEEQPQK